MRNRPLIPLPLGMLRLSAAGMRRAGTKPRTLVLCFDGTTNVYDDTNTNVVKLFSLLKRDDQEEQMVYYQPGVGTYVPPGMLLPITLKLAKVVDQGIALYLNKHVMGGYEFLMKHYRHGDKICLFGFSRGAYTARALAGMLHKVGLLPPDNVEQIPFAYSMYIRSDKVGFEESAGFKASFCREVEIEFIGVWPFTIYQNQSNPIVKTFRHAVSLDERRAKFKDHLCHAHAKPSREHEPTKLGDSGLSSPMVQTDSPVVAFRPLPKSQGSTLKNELDITVTDATPPTDCETPPDTAVDRPLIWGGTRGDDTLPTASHKQIPTMSINGPWHSQERTHVEVPALGVEEKPILLGGSDMDHAHTSLRTIRFNDALHPSESKGNTEASGSHKFKPLALNLISDWLGTPRKLKNPKKRSTDSSCDFEYEAKLDAQCRLKKGGSERQTDVLEVWFAGGHSDVGGGAMKDTEEYQLSNISLRWMIRQIISSRCGIEFDTKALKAMHISPATVGLTVENYTSSYSSPVNRAKHREEQDALAKLNDSLRNPGWWPLEFIPLLRVSKDKDGGRHPKIRFNLFRGRRPHSSDGKIKVHISVLYRENNLTGGYKYKARVPRDDIEWVD
ncbi:unnamed protein product [Rhizoctonia solani]|uniref:T6SS Phospholipase effector Tle1-like catalytic domain-containing protein n=1 Tax=Rhizoctonia solani TaxID=456999 RepID=A0A8H3H3P5_9AGAM|nr:unnamed protein product [Rhizoctonia solani]